MVQPFWKTVWKFLKNVKQSYHMIQEFQSWVSTQEKWKPVHIKTYTQMFTAALFIITPKWKQHKCPLMDEWIIKIWYIHTTEYSSLIKLNDVLILLQHAWSLKILLERSQSQKTTYCMTPFIWNVQNRQNCGDRK